MQLYPKSVVQSGIEARPVKLFQTLIAITVLVSPVYAQKGQEGEKRKKDKRHGHSMPGGFLKVFDVNKDGKVSREEFGKGGRVSRLDPAEREKLFSRLDKDGSGFIDPKEMVSHRGRSPMEKADTDKDGRISKEEFFNHPPFSKIPADRLGKMFERFDQNSDGFIDRKDGGPAGWRKGPRGDKFPRLRMEELDTDKSGTLSREEFHKSPGLKNLSEKDRNHAFQRLDDDKNGELSPNELRPPFERGGRKPPKRDPKK